ncbi:MAG: prepilin-type N-terminal cleavage/methylation domain-containing protein [Candidatus Omnitrophica bacterium]|nr:prepilin-type N-terminal cleavage/methylation domain-containing protein [Candidatus Omnitrophota bacterium]
MKKGFTVIELIIVISVLVILIGIIVPRMNGMQQQGYITKVQAELLTLQSAMESYYNNSPKPASYPPSSPSPCVAYFIWATPRIITSAMYDPFSPASEYDLVTSVNGQYYVFGSVGVNGRNFDGFTIDNTGTVNKGSNTNIICITNGIGC